MAKKKKPSDKKQTSLFSFGDDAEKKEKEKRSISKKKEEIEKPKKSEEDSQLEDSDEGSDEDIEEETEGSDEFEDIQDFSHLVEDSEVDEPKKIILKRKEKINPIPKDKFFTKDESPFGLKSDDFTLEKIEQRESASSKHLRMLIEQDEIVQNLERGLLLDVDYDGLQNKAYCKFYDLETNEIKIWLDTTDHEAYCLSKETVTELESNIQLTNYRGLKRMEEFEMFDLLKDKSITVTKLYGDTPLDIGGGRKTNIRKILESTGLKAWEADIRYHLNYIYDRQLVPGLIYRINEGKLEKLPYNEQSSEFDDVANELLNLFKDESKELREFAEKNLDIFLTPIPDVTRMALDIEVSMGENEYVIPDPRLAKQEVISVSFVASDGFKRVYMLEREEFSYDEPHDKFPDDAELYFFKSEKELLKETFRLMWKYPIIVTFNGDNFDLNYLSHRATNLRIDRDLNPIIIKRGYGIMSQAECYLRNGIHIDLFNFFFNRSISGYAFGGAYTSNSLNAISKALLGEEKYSHEEEIHEMEYNILAWYNLKDSILTLDLTKYNNNLVWNLIMLLCRITKMPIHDMLHYQISNWVKNIFLFEHRRKNYIIPRRSDIRDLKKGGFSKSTIDGKSFQGAKVVDPVPGIHFDVVVMDFASLYPSIIKEYNLSYETVQCPHAECRDNMIKGIPYHVCTQKKGIFAYVVGFLRDIRVGYFKPKSGDKSLSEDKRSYYTTIQQALKVFINSAYGVFGSENFPLFCLPVAESTTAIGRYSIEATIKESESMGVPVLYGDSDSVFLLNPSSEQLKDLSEWSKEELDLDLEEEKTYQFLALSERKKNYVGIYKDTKYVDIKGMVAKKSNTPNFIKKVFNNLTSILKEITDMEQFANAKKEIIEIVRQNLKKIGKEEAFPLEDYVINIGLRKKLDSYNKVEPQHVRAARELIRLKKQKAKSRDASPIELEAIEQTFQKGETISIVKTKGSNGARVVELAKLQDVDVKKYKELLKSALEQILDALGISFEEIKGIKKMDAFF